MFTFVQGVDGSGKSTQLSLLQKWLESEGYRHVLKGMEFVDARSRRDSAGQEEAHAHRAEDLLANAMAERAGA